MKNPLLAVLLGSLLLACPKKAPDSTPDANDLEQSKEELGEADRDGALEDEAGTADSGSAMDAGTSDAGTGTAVDAGTLADAGTKPATDAGTITGRSTRPGPGAAAKSEEACVDAWLKARSLDKYGHPEGTMYAGGTPLFDERTGETRERLPYVYSRQPEAKAACAK
jgi:hypothetical protein